MGFDITTAKPVGFDVSTAKPVEEKPGFDLGETVKTNLKSMIPGQGIDPVSVAETGITMGAGAAGEILGGIAGIIQALNPVMGQGAGANAVEGVRDALSYSPNSPGGQRALSTIGD